MAGFCARCSSEKQIIVSKGTFLVESDWSSICLVARCSFIWWMVLLMTNRCPTNPFWFVCFFWIAMIQKNRLLPSQQTDGTLCIHGHILEYYLFSPYMTCYMFSTNCQLLSELRVTGGSVGSLHVTDQRQGETSWPNSPQSYMERQNKARQTDKLLYVCRLYVCRMYICMNVRMYVECI